MDVTTVVEAQLDSERDELDIHSGLFRVRNERLARTPDDYRQFIDDPESQFVVAEDTTSGEIAGLGLARIRNQEGCLPNRSGEIVDIWVDPGQEGKDLRTKIAIELTRFFKLNGVHSMTVDYAKEDLEAESLWYRLSFKPVLVTAVAMLDEVETCFMTKSLKD